MPKQQKNHLTKGLEMMMNDFVEQIRLLLTARKALKPF
jgi:hypothetical protein